MKRMIFILLFVPLLLFAKDKRMDSVKKFSAENFIYLNVNRINTPFYNWGVWMINHWESYSNWGMEWPKGTGLYIGKGSGQWVSAKVGDKVHSAIVRYEDTAYQAGEIISPNQPADRQDPKYRWYELRSDGTGDWDDWPVDQGAPVDSNGNPLLYGDQMIFSVWNALRPEPAAYIFTSDELNLEVRQIAWAYNALYALGDMVFIKWQLVNKSGVDWDSTFFSIWADAQIGRLGGNTVVGCDSTSNCGFGYCTRNDHLTYGNGPPAVGITFLQGPIISNMASAVTMPNGLELNNHKMLGMTSFLQLMSISLIDEPRNALDAWFFQRGYSCWGNHYRPITYGEYGTNPYNPPTKFMYSGDPETGAGWICSDGGGSSIFLMTTGPFPMPAWQDENENGLPDFREPGVQEIVAAVICARGTSNLNSVTELKKIARIIQDSWWAGYFEPDEGVTPFKPSYNSFALGYNYPNPFNSETTIRYIVPYDEKVKLTIYNIKGQKIRDLLEVDQVEGLHSQKWDGKDNAGNPVVSGIYLCVMEAGLYSATKKMLVVR